MHRKDKQGFKKRFCEDGLVGAFPKGIGRTNLEIVRRIEEYTKRTLANSNDILNGILGIFNPFERSDMKVKHYLGILILPPMTKAPTILRRYIQASPRMDPGNGTACWSMLGLGKICRKAIWIS
jgi:hypothetical protein